MQTHPRTTAKGRNPRTSLPRATRILAPALAGTLVLTVCDAIGPTALASSASHRSHTLNVAFTADTQPPDPDVFYAGQGLAITTSVYQGLLQYAPNSTAHKIIPDLATSWHVSPNGRTYTFDLRKGVHFHDGTLFTSASVKASIARRLAVDQAPAYMVTDVASVDDANPSVAVIHLKQPNSAFLDYLASAYGPRMLSPTALKAHAGKDADQTWLRTHDAGTGPYEIASVVPGQKYVLKAFDHYWGAKPYYTTVNISIVPDMSTQQLLLQGGQLSLIMNDYLPGPAIASLRTNHAFSVHEVPTLEMPMIWVNPNKGFFSHLDARKALAEAINRTQIVEDVFPGRATVSTQIYPQGILPKGTAKFDPRYDPAVLTKLVSRRSGKQVSLAYQADDPTAKQMANLLQAQLAATGLQVSVEAVPEATIYAWPGHPGPNLPDLLIETNWPDAYNPDTWARIVMSQTGGLNYLDCSVPAGTKLLDAGRAAVNPASVESDYEKAGAVFAASDCWIPLANKEGTVVTPTWMTGVSYQDAVPHTVILADLRPR